MNASAPEIPISAPSRGINRREIIQKLSEVTQQAYDHILVFSNAVDQIAESSAQELMKRNATRVGVELTNTLDIPRLQSALAAHLLKTLCISISDTLLRYEAWSNNIRLESDQNNDKLEFELLQRPLLPTDRNAILSDLPSKLAEPYRRLYSTFSSTPLTTALQSFSPSFESATNASDIRIKKLDKKKQRTVVFALRKSLETQLSQETRLSVAFHLTILLIHAKVSGTILHAPSRCIHQIFELLQSSLKIEPLRQLIHIQQLLQLQSSNESTKCNSDSSDNNNNDDSLLLLRDYIQNVNDILQ
jgi:hypothetical protein